MSVPRVRVELKSKGKSEDQKDRDFKTMLSIFKRRVNEEGILDDYKRSQVFEKPGDKRRRKRKESQILKKKAQLELKSKLKKYFG